MKKLRWGDIVKIGITSSNLISIEFYEPNQMDGSDFKTIFLTLEQLEDLYKLGVIVRGKTN